MKSPRILQVCFVLIMTACSVPVDKPNVVPFVGGETRLSRVVDGDTIEVVLPDSTEETVRIIGIDTPEYQECYFEEATAYLQVLMVESGIVLQTQPGDNRDKYHRLLRYVHVDDRDIGLQLLRDGYAKNYPWFTHPRTEQYKAAEQEAQQQGRGLWGACE